MIRFNAPLRTRTARHPFRHRYPTTMPMHRAREKTMIKNSARAWINGIVAFVMLLIIAGAIALQANQDSPSQRSVKVPVGAEQPRVVPDAYSLPFCELEDGSTQDLCLWDDETGDQIVNVGYGHWSYNRNTGQIVEYDSHK